MKKSTFLTLVMVSAVIAFMMTGCRTSENDAGSIDGQHNADEIHEPGEVQEETPVILEMNGMEIRGTLNNTLTAREFLRLLPYSVTVSRAADDLCGSVSENLPSDSSEGKDSWKIGEIGWFGGWFTILVDNEEQFSDMPGIMIIGKIDEADIPAVQALDGRVAITVRLPE